MSVKNEVKLCGYVGEYVRLPTRRGDPARFDILTPDKVKTTDGQVITLQNWHTIQTDDIDFVRDHAEPRAEILVTGRLVCRQTQAGKEVEIVAKRLEIIQTAEERRR